MKFRKLSLVLATSALMAAPLSGNASWHDDDDEEPFDEARLFFELNDTDGDLGIHGKVDGDEWRYLEIEDPHDRKMMNIWIRGRLRRQGLTELFFESAEPTFDELEPADFFNRFPEGEYDIEGITLDWEERESEVYLSQVIPAAPDGVSVNGTPQASKEDCDVEDGDIDHIMDLLVEIDENGDEEVTIEWEPVAMSHAAKHGPLGPDPRDIALGSDGVIDVRYYEVVVEVDGEDFKSTAIIPGDGETEWALTDDFFELAEGHLPGGGECEDADIAAGNCYAQYKYEILVRTNVHDAAGNPVMVVVDDEDDNLAGNKSAVESCFYIQVDEND